MNVLLEPNPKAKRELQERITDQLPQWFGKAQANAKYAALAETLDGYTAEIGGIRLTGNTPWVSQTCPRNGTADS